MKRILFVCLALAAMVIVLPTLTIVTAQPKGKPKPLVAVMPFKVEMTNNKRDWEANCFEMCVDELTKSGKVRVLSREQIDQRKTANADNLQDAGLGVWILDPARAKAVGETLGVRYLLMGYINDQLDPNKRHTVTMKVSLIDTSTGEIVWADEASATDSSDIKAAKSCVKQLVKKLTGPNNAFGFG